jgi:hypothetical protein
MDEMWLIFIKEMSMVPYLMNFHPMETILSENDLSVSTTMSPTIQSIIHLTSFLATGDDVPKSERFEL